MYDVRSVLKEKHFSCLHGRRFHHKLLATLHHKRQWQTIWIVVIVCFIMSMKVRFLVATILMIVMLSSVIPAFAASGGNGGSVIAGPGNENNGGAHAGNGGNGGASGNNNGNGGSITSTGSSNNGGASAGNGGSGGAVQGSRRNIAEMLRIRLLR